MLTSTSPHIPLEESWKKQLQHAFAQSYMNDLRSFLQQETQAGKLIHPAPQQFFSALNLTPFKQVKVVILGQDPYHGDNQAHGLSFSVPPSIPTPPSLRNIYKELQNDLNIPIAEHGCLIHWAKQGVLLLNSVLSVEHAQAASHQGKGWEKFTDNIIANINEHSEHCVFILWGAYAQKKGACIDADRHLLITAPHPSPLSAHRGFFGGQYFSRCNDYLSCHGKKNIDWQLPDIATANAQYQQIASLKCISSNACSI